MSTNEKEEKKEQKIQTAYTALTEFCCSGVFCLHFFTSPKKETVKNKSFSQSLFHWRYIMEKKKSVLYGGSETKRNRKRSLWRGSRSSVEYETC